MENQSQHLEELQKIEGHNFIIFSNQATSQENPQTPVEIVRVENTVKLNSTFSEKLKSAKLGLQSGRAGSVLGSIIRNSLATARINLVEFQSEINTGKTTDENIEIEALVALEESISQNEELLKSNKKLEKQIKDKNYQVAGWAILTLIAAGSYGYQYIKPNIEKPIAPKVSIKEACESGAESLTIGNSIIKCAIKHEEKHEEK